MQIDCDQVIENISKGLENSGWAQILRPFLISPDMEHIIEQLVQIKKQGEYFCPTLVKVFRWLQVCPVDKVKVIMVTDLTNSFIHLNSGIPMYIDRQETPFLRPSRVQQGIFDTIKKGYIADIMSWCDQGCLIIPLSPTSVVEGTAHHQIWKPFIAYLTCKINELYPDIPVIVLGRRAIAYRDMFNSKYTRSIILWPQVESNKSFKWANTVLVKSGKSAIKW